MVGWVGDDIIPWLLEGLTSVVNLVSITCVVSSAFVRVLVKVDVLVVEARNNSRCLAGVRVDELSG